MVKVSAIDLFFHQSFGFLLQLLECLAIITFVGANDPEETEKSIQIIWQLVHPKQGSNVCTCVDLYYQKLILVCGLIRSCN